MNIRSSLYAPDNGSSGGGGGAGGGAGGAPAGAGGASSTLLSGSGGAGAGGGGAGPGSGDAGTGGGGAGSGGAAGAAGAAGTSAPWFVGLYGQDGKINEKAFDALPDHLKPHRDTFAKYKTVEALLGGMGNLANLAGKKALAPLPKDAPDELKAERAALMRSLNGTPEKPDGYGIKKPDGVPDEQWNGEYVNGILGVLHKHNASPELVQELVALDQEFAGKLRANGEAAETLTRKQEADALKAAFGSDFDKKLSLAQRAAKTLGLDVNDPAIGNSSKLIIALAKAGEMVSEDRLVSGDAQAGAGQTDRERALDILNNPANPLHKAYHDAEHPQHKQAVEQRSAFNKRWLEAQARARKQSAA